MWELLKLTWRISTTRPGRTKAPARNNTRPGRTQVPARTKKRFINL
jgi:hypothetical protein